MTTKSWGALGLALVLMAGLLAPAHAAPNVAAATAGTKPVGQVTNTWGRVSEPGARQVWTEVQLPGGAWSRSQVGQTKADGSYVLELSYGFTSKGTYTYRVGAATSAGTTYSSPFTLQRTGWTVGSVADKPVGQATNAWGTVGLAAGRTVWTEALVGGRWSRSRVGTANASGYFVLPLTYGVNDVGRHTFRVGASTPRGTVYSESFAINRTSRHSVSASAAPVKMIGEHANAWGKVSGVGGRAVWTEVWLGDRWSVSQRRTASASGDYVIPLTYGRDVAGVYTFRVGAATPSGNVYSQEFDVYRLLFMDPDLSSGIARAINGHRVSGAYCGTEYLYPVSALASHPDLDLAAYLHANDMATYDFWDSIGSDGSTPESRVAAIGYDAVAVLQMDAAGSIDADAVVGDWMANADTCRRIMDPDVTEIGSAMVWNERTQVFTYWTAILAQPAS